MRHDASAERPRTAAGDGETLVELFQRTVDTYPDHPAASDGERRLTYAELGRRSDALAGSCGGSACAATTGW